MVIQVFNMITYLDYFHFAFHCLFSLVSETVWLARSCYAVKQFVPLFVRQPAELESIQQSTNPR